MSRKKLSAGDTVEARCTRCRVVTNHTIVAMVGEQVVRVQCNTCGGVHNYKPPVTEKASAARAAAPKAPAAPRRTTRDPAAAERAEWEALRPSLQPERALPYTMDAALKVGNLVQHPVFGLGVVQCVGVGKAEVLFEGGKKLLRCR